MAGGSRVWTETKTIWGWVFCISATTSPEWGNLKNNQKKIEVLAAVTATAGAQVASTQGLWPGCVFPSALGGRASTSCAKSPTGHEVMTTWRHCCPQLCRVVSSWLPSRCLYGLAASHTQAPTTQGSVWAFQEKHFLHLSSEMSWGDAHGDAGRHNSLILGNHWTLTAGSASSLTLHFLQPPNAADTDSHSLQQKLPYFICRFVCLFVYWSFLVVLSWFLPGLRTQQWTCRLWLYFPISSPTAHKAFVPSAEAGFSLRSRLLQPPLCEVQGFHQASLCK